MFINKRISDFNIADWLSAYRIAAAPVILLLVLFSQKEIFSWLLLVSFATDIADGLLARKLNIKSEAGTRLDSLGDLLTLLVAIIGIVKFETDFIKQQHISLLALISVYLLQMALSLWRYRRISNFHTYLVKLAFLFQGIFILTLLFFGYYSWLFYITLAASMLSSVEEIIIVFVLPEHKSNVKGLYWVLKKESVN